MFDFLNKSLKLTPAQRKAARFAVDIASDLLDQASDEDETPLEITVMEALEVAGQRLAGKLGK